MNTWQTSKLFRELIVYVFVSFHEFNAVFAFALNIRTDLFLL